jgi:DNA-binding MltR family transcriptional regulator
MRLYLKAKADSTPYTMSNIERLLETIVDRKGIYAQLEPYFHQLHKETDRGYAIVAAILLDGLLETLLRKKMIPSVPNEIFSGYGPLSSFSAKIDLSFYLGFISRGEYDELHQIRRIRNEFAHSLNAPLSFSHPPVCDRISSLRFTGSSLLKEETSKRVDFEISVLVLIGFLYAIIERSTPPKPPKDSRKLVVDPNA